MRFEAACSRLYQPSIAKNRIQYKCILPNSFSTAIKLTEEATSFLDTLGKFSEMSRLRISWTAPKAMAKEKRLYAMWTENLDNRKLVAELQNNVVEAQQQMHDRAERSDEVLADFEQQLVQINNDIEERIEQIV